MTSTLALVQLAREFAECGREADAARVMDEACEDIAEPVRQTWQPNGKNWGGYTFANVISRERMRAELQEDAEPKWRKRSPYADIGRGVADFTLVGQSNYAGFAISREQLYRTVRVSRPEPPAYAYTPIPQEAYYLRDSMIRDMYAACGLNYDHSSEGVLRGRRPFRKQRRWTMRIAERLTQALP